MEISIVLGNTEDGQVEIEGTRLSYSGETSQSVIAASILADELRNKVEKMGTVEVTACGVPVSDLEDEEWEEV